MPSQYPAAVDGFPDREDGQGIHASHVVALQDAVVAIQSTLGIDPQGMAETVSARIAAANQVPAIADHPMSAPRAVTFSESGGVRYLDATHADDVGRLPLVTLQAAAEAGYPVQVVSSGIVPWPAGGLSRGESLFLGPDGWLMTSQPMNVAFTQIIAYALDADSIFVDPQQPILI